MRRLVSFAALLMCCVALSACEDLEEENSRRWTYACEEHRGVQSYIEGSLICKDGYTTANW